MSRSSEAHRERILEQKGLLGKVPTEIARMRHDEFAEPAAPGAEADALEHHGTPDTLNLDAIMAQRVGKAPTTVRIIRLPTVRAVVAEAAPLVDYLEPFAPGSRTEPSPVLSLILKLALFRLSKKQLMGLLARSSAPLVRGAALLYARLLLPPSDLWQWIGKWVEDGTSVQIEPRGPPGTVGEVARELLEATSFRGLRLPRIPIPLARELRAHLLVMEASRPLVEFNRSHPDALAPGKEVMAVSSDDSAWHPARLLEPARGPDLGHHLEGQAWWVVFPEYGNNDVCGLGEIRVLPGQGVPSPDEAGVPLPPTVEEATEAARAADRDGAAASGKAYARGVKSFSQSLVEVQDIAVRSGAAAASSRGAGRCDEDRRGAAAVRPRGHDDLDGGARRRKRVRPAAEGPPAGRAGGGSGYDDRRAGGGGGYDDRRAGGGGGYDDRRAGGGGGYDDRRAGGGGGYDDRRAGGGGGYDDRRGGYGGGGYDDRRGGYGGGGYDDRRAGGGGGYDDRRAGGGGYDDRRGGYGGGGYDDRRGGYGGGGYDDRRGGYGGGGYDDRRAGGGGGYDDRRAGGGGYDNRRGGYGGGGYDDRRA
ncbi:hypothetical protein FNF27_02048 [Cafeteria roenbergensis]|uniref:Pre-mRNA-splicing factor 38 n=1 Tax=Cafeteria roenbergensis TaxID=33653 RepID=A0A5A8EFQ1_CAFRO|nr:hypothetical protein FNF27_02048 [Cafeteria roenbergensis]